MRSITRRLKKKNKNKKTGNYQIIFVFEFVSNKWKYITIHEHSFPGQYIGIANWKEKKKRNEKLEERNQFNEHLKKKKKNCISQ